MRREVAEAFVRTHIRFAEIEARARGVRSGAEALAGDLIRVQGREGLPIELLDSLRHLAAERRDYLDAIVDYNKAQFELYVALGKPPADMLARPVPQDMSKSTQTLIVPYAAYPPAATARECSFSPPSQGGASGVTNQRSLPDVLAVGYVAVRRASALSLQRAQRGRRELPGRARISTRSPVAPAESPAPPRAAKRKKTTAQKPGQIVPAGHLAPVDRASTADSLPNPVGGMDSLADAEPDPLRDLLNQSATPIDLTTALQLAGQQNPTILLGQQRVVEAVAQRQLAAVQFLPTINLGTSVDSHWGVLQQPTGNILSVRRESVFVGAGANAVGAGTVDIPGVVVESECF